MRKSLITIICLSALLMSCRQANLVREGDLLFCIADEDNAITDVTQGIDGMKIEHVGIYHDRNVIEATKSKGVCITPIDSFISQNGGRVIVGRVANADIRQSIDNALSHLGLPYDTLFMPDDRAMYCSELVQKSFVDRRARIIFEPIPMSFHDESGQITPFWTDFYRQRGMEVPEGKPGSNPGEMSRRRCVSIIRRW